MDESIQGYRTCNIAHCAAIMAGGMCAKNNIYDVLRSFINLQNVCSESFEVTQ